MIAEDSIYIPFSKIDPQIKPITTINLIDSYETSIRGCNRKCACRLWVNCHYYNKIRLKRSREYDDEHMRIIWDYYNNIFRITFDMPMVNMNG